MSCWLPGNYLKSPIKRSHNKVVNPCYGHWSITQERIEFSTLYLNCINGDALLSISSLKSIHEPQPSYCKVTFKWQQKGNDLSPPKDDIKTNHAHHYHQYNIHDTTDRSFYKISSQCYCLNHNKFLYGQRWHINKSCTSLSSIQHTWYHWSQLLEDIQSMLLSKSQGGFFFKLLKHESCSDSLEEDGCIICIIDSTIFAGEGATNTLSEGNERGGDEGATNIVLLNNIKWNCTSIFQMDMQGRWTVLI